MNAASEHVAYALNMADPLDRGTHQCIDGLELLGKQVGHCFANVRDGQAGQHAGKTSAFAGRDAIDQVL